MQSTISGPLSRSNYESYSVLGSKSPVLAPRKSVACALLVSLIVPIIFSFFSAD